MWKRIPHLMQQHYTPRKGVNLVTQLVTQKISQRGVKQITLNKKKIKKKESDQT